MKLTVVFPDRKSSSFSKFNKNGMLDLTPLILNSLRALCSLSDAAAILLPDAVTFTKRLSKNGEILAPE